MRPTLEQLTQEWSVDQGDYELLERIERGGHVFRPDRSDEGRAIFQQTVADLLRLRGIGLIRLPEGKLMRAEDGPYLMAGPCDLTPAGIAELANDRRLGPRAPRNTMEPPHIG